MVVRIKMVLRQKWLSGFYMLYGDPTVLGLRHKVSHGLLDGWNAAVSRLRQKDPFTLYFLSPRKEL
jgi:hypothetical protein